MAVNAKKLLLKAKGLLKRGLHEQARQIYSTVLKAYPKNHDAKVGLEHIEFLGQSRKELKEGYSFSLELKALFDEFKFDEIISLSKAEGSRIAEDPLALNICAAAYKKLGKVHEAILYYKKSIEINPDFIEAYNNLGTSFMTLGDLESARSCFKIVLEKRPTYAMAHNGLGLIFYAKGQTGEALECYLQAINLSPDLSEAHDNLGNLYAELRENDKAINSYKEAIRVASNNVSAMNNLAILLKELGRLDESIKLYEEAISISPKFVEAHSNLGTLHLSRGDYDRAVKNYKNAIEIDPNYFQAQSNLIFSITSEGKLSNESVLTEARKFGDMISSQSKFRYRSWNCDYSTSLLRIGFVSGDISNHPVGYFLEGVLHKLGKEQFELYAYSTSSLEDDLTKRVRPFFTKWRMIAQLGWCEAAEKIYKDDLHILIDLSGHTASNGLPIFAYKPAPIQCSWLGYFGTTGVAEIDYLIGDPHVTPPEEEFHFSEKICRLPETYLCFTEPVSQVEVGSLPALQNGYTTFGCFNNLSKITDEVISTWAKILRNLQDSRLFLKSKQLDSDDLRQKTKERFEACDIGSDRLLLEGASDREEYFSSYNRVDLMLDPFPYPGGTTSVEALWMGAPSVVMKGTRFLSHLGESIAFNSGQSEWVARTQEEYVSKAVTFGSDLDSLARLRQSLRGTVLDSPLFNHSRFAAHFSKVLRDIWQARDSRK